MIFDNNDRLLFTAQTGYLTPVPDTTTQLVSSAGFAGNPNAGAVITGTAASNALEIRGDGYTLPLHLLIRYTGGQNTGGANTAQFTLQTSPDNATWTDFMTSGQVPLQTTPAASGSVDLPFQSQARYIRLNTVIAGSGTAPTITVLSADLIVANP